MTKFTQIVLLGSALAVSAPLALAAPINPLSGSISIAGSDTLYTNYLTFTPNTPTDSDVAFNGSDDLAIFDGGTVTMDSNPLYFNSSADNTELFSIASILDPGALLTFEISSLTATSSGANNEELNGNGILTDNLIVDNTPYSPTDATFTLTTSTDGDTSFQLDPAVTPEPSSLLLLGTGLVSAAGMMFRKRSLLS